MSEIPGSSPFVAVDHVDALPVGTRLAEFEIVGLLGVGGFGMVYQAFDHSLLRFVAIKEYMPTTLAGRTEGGTLWVRSSADEAAYTAGLASFVEEARLLAQFDHPSLVKVFRFWEANRTAYMVMPLYAGMTLKQARTHMRAPPSEEWLRKVIWSVCGALRVLHDGKTLHRDISPDNIFLQDNGPPVLLDLGAARFAIGDRDRKHTAVLKVNYAPIEQYADADSELKPGPWSDLYSFAAVIYGFICNDVPLPSTLRSIRDRMVSFSRVARTVRKQFGVEYSAPFVETITKALSLQPRDRHWTVDAFLEQMGLVSAPAQLDKFDFRAELGENWIDPTTVGSGSSVMLDLSDVSEPAPGPGNGVPDGGLPPLAPPDAQAVRRRNTDNVQTVLHIPDSAKPARSEPPPPAQSTAEADFQDTVVRSPDFDDSVMEPYAPVPVPAQQAASASGQRTASADRRSAGKHRAGVPAKTGSRSRPAAAARWSGARRALVASAAAVVLLAGAAALYVTTLPASGPSPQAVVEAEPPAPVPTPEADIVTEVNDPPVEHTVPASEVVPVAAVASEAKPAASFVPAFTVSKDQKPRVAPPVRKPVEAPAAHEPVAATPAPKITQASATPAAAPRRVNPEDACAGSSFLAKPMCVHNQCQKPGMESHPVCVESKRQRDEERRQRQMYTQ